MDSQFIHLNTYGREASKLKGAKVAKKGDKKAVGAGQWSARNIFSESLREEGHCLHVPSPMPPSQLYGNVYKLADEYGALTKDGDIRRKDTPILIAGVVSAPWAVHDPRSKDWRADTLEFLKVEFGENLRSAIGHNDETNDHIHFYVAHKDNIQRPIDDIHPGLKAKKDAGDAAKKYQDGKAIFDDAMQKFQDRYQEQVAIKHGQARIGPARERVDRTAWLKQRSAVEQRQVQQDELDQKEVLLKAKLRDVAKQKDLLQIANEIQLQEKLLKLEIDHAELTKHHVKGIELAHEKIREERKTLHTELKIVQEQKSVMQEVFSTFFDKIEKFISSDLLIRFSEAFKNSVVYEAEKIAPNYSDRLHYFPDRSKNNNKSSINSKL
jgi:hypothetical protein